MSHLSNKIGIGKRRMKRRKVDQKWKRKMDDNMEMVLNYSTKKRETKKKKMDKPIGRIKDTGTRLW